MLANVLYTDEERELSSIMCDAINADKELKVFFKETLGKTLQKFYTDMLEAQAERDVTKIGMVTQQTAEVIKALAMHMHVKVVVKKKEAK